MQFIHGIGGYGFCPGRGQAELNLPLRESGECPRLAALPHINREGGWSVFWSLYLPIAGNGVNILLLLGLGGAVGFLSGLFGVGGGFLMTPLLIMAGIPSTVAAASDSNQIVAASTSGTYAHYRLGNVDFKMGLLLLVGGVVGGTLGVQLIKMLRALGNADFVIKITYVVMLGVVGFYMFVESLQSMRRKTPDAAGSAPR